MVSGPEVSQLVHQYKLVSLAKFGNEDIRHHEQTSQSQKAFTGMVKKLFSAMKDLANPFQEESKDLLTLYTNIIAHPGAAELVRTHTDKGQAAFKYFNNSHGDEASFYKPIKRTKLTSSAARKQF